MNVDTLRDYITCFRLSTGSVSIGLVSLVVVMVCLLVSTVFRGFRSALLSVFSSWLLMGGLFGFQMASY